MPDNKNKKSKPFDNIPENVKKNLRFKDGPLEGDLFAPTNTRQNKSMKKTVNNANNESNVIDNYNTNINDDTDNSNVDGDVGQQKGYGGG